MEKRLGVYDHLDALLLLGAQIKVVLVELANQLPAVDVEAGLQLVVGERAGLLAGKEADEGAVDNVGATEPSW
jgi:hypothetical protein